jgi:hypothetical protein
VGDEDAERELNELNQGLVQSLQRKGEVFLSNAVIRGRYALRACIVNFHTEEGDVDAVPAIVLREGRAAEAELAAAAGEADGRGGNGDPLSPWSTRPRRSAAPGRARAARG